MMCLETSGLFPPGWPSISAQEMLHSSTYWIDRDFKCNLCRVAAASIPQWSWVNMGYLMNDLNLVYNSEDHRGQARRSSNLRSWWKNTVHAVTVCQLQYLLYFISFCSLSLFCFHHDTFVSIQTNILYWTKTGIYSKSLMVWFCFWWVCTETHIIEAILEDQQWLRAVAKDDKRDIMFTASFWCMMSFTEQGMPRIDCGEPVAVRQQHCLQSEWNHPAHEFVSSFFAWIQDFLHTCAQKLMLWQVLLSFNVYQWCAAGYKLYLLQRGLCSCHCLEGSQKHGCGYDGDSRRPSCCSTLDAWDIVKEVEHWSRRFHVSSVGSESFHARVTLFEQVWFNEQPCNPKLNLKLSQTCPPIDTLASLLAPRLCLRLTV